MTFGDTLLATLVGALAGALIGAFAAWLFSLDLRRRDREDRVHEREQEALDRLAQREQERGDRLAEREEERELRKNEREQDRRENYEAEIMRQWPRIADELMEYANANRAVVDREITGAGAEVFKRYRQSVTTLMGCLHEVATIARGLDHEIVNNLGVMLAVLQPHQRETVEAVDRIRTLVGAYMTARPDRREDAKKRLRSELLKVAGLGPDS